MLPNLSEAMRLTIEQEFMLKACQLEAPNIPQIHLRMLALDLMRQVMIKDNVIRTLTKTIAASDHERKH